MARELLLFRLAVNAPAAAFDDLAAAAERQGIPWERALARLERETLKEARRFALARIEGWKLEAESWRLEAGG